MGLLDQFSNLNEDQTQGLLAAAAQMLQSSGPSTKPVGLNQILGGGWDGYMNGVDRVRKRKLEEDASKQMAQLRGLQIQEAQGGLADHDRARQQADLLRQFYTQQRLGQTPTAATGAGGAPQMASAMPGGAASVLSTAYNGTPYSGPDGSEAYVASEKAGMKGYEPDKINQVMALRRQGLSLEQAAASIFGGNNPTPTQAPTQQASASAPQSQGDPFSQRMALAQQLRQAGFHAEADKQEETALKFKPKFANEPRTVRGPDGQPMLVQTADDGTVRPIQGGYGVAEKLNFHDMGGTVAGLDPYSGKQLQTFNKTQTPDSLASTAQQRARLAFDQSQAGGESSFTDGAIANAAARYNIDGTLPPMGMGKAGSLGRSAILNKAAELAASSGLTGDQQRIQQIGNKANTAALSKIQQQQTMIGAFEKNFNANADIALEYSAKVDRTGVPLANKWINAGKRSIAGDPDLAAYDQAIKSTANEYAKIVSGSMGNTAIAEGEIKKVESLLNSAQTPDQVNAVINLMKRETQNRMKGFDDEKASLRGSMTGGGPADGAKPPQGAAAGGGTPTMASMPTPNANNRGRTLVDHDTGKRYKSNGLQWQEVK
jgi:hypothetical protein